MRSCGHIITDSRVRTYSSTGTFHTAPDSAVLHARATWVFLHLYMAYYELRWFSTPSSLPMLSWRRAGQRNMPTPASTHLLLHGHASLAYLHSAIANESPVLSSRLFDGRCRWRASKRRSPGIWISFPDILAFRPAPRLPSAISYLDFIPLFFSPLHFHNFPTMQL